MWCMFRLQGVWVAEMHKGTFDIPQHRDVHSALIVVPLQGEASILGGFPIFGDLVMVMECSQEMGGIVPVGVMHCKVINNQSEVDVWVSCCQSLRLEGHGW